MYLDILFLYNLVVNTLLLYASGYLLKLKIKPVRLLLGGIFGAFYGIFSVICKVHPFLNAFLKLLCAFVMVYISYRQSLRGYVRLLCTLFISSFCLCGIYMGFSAYTHLKGSEDALFLNLGFPYIFIVFIVFLLFLNLYIEGVYIRIRNRELYKNVEIENMGKKVRLSGFVDTGNSLITPEGFPVAFVNKKYTEKISQESLYTPVCFSTVNGETERMGFTPDKFYIDGKEKTYTLIPVDEDFEKNFDILLGGVECSDL